MSSRPHVDHDLRRDAGAVETGRLCPRCGSSVHGRPWARDDAGPLHVSLSYATGLAVVVWSRTTEVGVHVVPADAIPPGGLTAADWARLEALAKLRGTGLVGEVGPPRAGETVTPLDAPPGYIARLAQAQDGEVDVRWVSATAGPAAPPSPATR